MDKKFIIRNFSRAALFYDQYADIQMRVAAELLAGIRKRMISNILEIGCGTGNYTLLLRDKYKNSKLKAMDISGEMIEAAREKLKGRGIEFIVADAEKKNLAGLFDLITSNAALQWFEDLEDSLFKYRSLLKENGAISFSIFGPLTFWELNSSLREVSKRISVEAARFKTSGQIKRILQLNFKNLEIKEKKYQETLPALRHLLEKIKYTGIRGGNSSSKVFLSPRTFKELEQVYLNKFGRIKATYQVFFCHGIKA